MTRQGLRNVGLLTLSLAGACASEDVVLFGFPGGGSAGAAGAGFAGTAFAFGGNGDSVQEPAGGADVTGEAGVSGGAPTTPISCREDADCPSAWGCEKATCIEEFGVCIPHPVCFDLEPNPVCGCDGITYWNNCLRKQVGPAASTPGECEERARRCWEERDCGPGSVCGHLVLPGDPCGPGPRGPDREPEGPPPPPPGRCWAIPDTCDPSLDPLRWNECGPQPGACTDTCDALRSGFPHVKNATGVCP